MAPSPRRSRDRRPSTAPRRRPRPARSARWSAAPSWRPGEVRDTTAVLLWPARMIWVGPETITSLIEAHGPDPATVLLPGWQGEPGWPVLVPLAHLAALRAIAPTLMPLDVIHALASAVPARVVEVGDPGVDPRRRHAPDDLARLPGPARAARRAHPRVGRRRRRRGRPARAVGSRSARLVDRRVSRDAPRRRAARRADGDPCRSLSGARGRRPARPRSGCGPAALAS